MGKLTSILLGALGTLGGLVLAAPPPAATPAPKAPKAIKLEPSKFGPSRYAGADIKGYVESLSKQFSSANRAVDPFCQQQDPEAKVVAKAPVINKITRRPVATTATPLSEIVGRLNITMVMPGTRRFIVDGRNLGVGDKLPITFRNARLQTEITEVSQNRVVFRNLETGEIGIHKFAGLGPGISRDTQSIKMPGTRPDAPLEIDSTPTNPSNP